MSEKDILFIRYPKKNLSKSSEGDSSTNDDDVWDDTLLIQAYDKAVQLAQQNYLKKKQGGDNGGSSKVKKKESDSTKWKIGDKCRCQYSEDFKYYEADIVDILKSGMCVVKYVGYENEEKVPIKKLRPSEGEEARSKQIEEALEEEEEGDAEAEESASSSVKKPQPNYHKKKGNSKSRNNFSENNQSFNFPFPPMGNAIIPPPPPPHMFNNLGEDETETEAMSAMLISWYMSGYHTGYYQGLKMGRKQ